MVVVHTYNPSILEALNNQQFNVNFDYIANSRPADAKWDNVSKIIQNIKTRLGVCV